MFAYIEGVYNTARMPSSLDSISRRECLGQFDGKLLAQKQQKQSLSESECSEPLPLNTAF